MPANPGRNPYQGNDSAPLVDIRYRSGLIVRAVEPGKRRWERWPEGPHDFDIVSYQLAEGRTYELLWLPPVMQEVSDPKSE